MRAKVWSDSLGIRAAKQHGGEFTGNHCRLLLNNIELLKSKLVESNSLNHVRPIVHALEAFKLVKDACFGQTLDPQFEMIIDQFGMAWAKTGMSFAPKIHAVLVHVPQFLNAKAEEHRFRQEKEGKPMSERTAFSRGLGYWSEQASESVHNDFHSLWVGASYKRGLTHPAYALQLKTCVATYNARHV